MKNDYNNNTKPLASVVRAMGRLIRPRYTAQVDGNASVSTLSGGAQKLEPIEDIVARSRRAPRAPE